MAFGDRIRALQAARAAGQTPILDAIRGGAQQPQAAPAAAPRPQQQVQQVTPRPQPAAAPARSSGDPSVAQLQQQLTAAGFDPGPIDGLMGPRTRAAMQAMEAARSAPAPTAGARPVPRPQSVQARDSMPAPLPMAVPGRAGVPGPPLERGAPMQVGRDIPGYVPAGWRPVPGGPADVPQQPSAPSPDMWQGRQGEDFAVSPRGRGMGVLTRNDIPDPAALDFRQMMDFESQWLSAGRRPEELGPAWEQARNLRRQQLDLEREMATRQAQQLQQQQQAQFLIDNGTNPRIAPPAAPVDRSIGEGQYLPAEMIRLGQLGANMNNAPQANTMLPQLGLLSGPRRPQRSLGQLASPGV